MITGLTIDTIGAQKVDFLLAKLEQEKEKFSAMLQKFVNREHVDHEAMNNCQESIWSYERSIKVITTVSIELNYDTPVHH